MAAKAGTNRPPANPSGPIINPPANHNDPDAALEIQLISYIGLMQQHDASILQAKGPYDAAKAARNKCRLDAKAAGFKLALLDQLIIDQKGNKRELVKDEAERAKMRRWLDLPVGDEAKTLFDALPMEEQDAAYWESQGYQTALRWQPATVPTGCPPRFTQSFLAGFETGAKRVDWAKREGASRDAAPAPEAAAPAEPELTPAQRRKAEKAEEERVKAALSKPPVNDALEALREVEPEMVAQAEDDYGDDEGIS
jgi:hypothetical protein